MLAVRGSSVRALAPAVPTAGTAMPCSPAPVRGGVRRCRVRVRHLTALVHAADLRALHALRVRRHVVGREHGLVRRLRDGDRLGLRVHELVADRLARIEPGLDRLRHARGALGEEDDRFVARCETLIGNREQRRVDLLLVLVEDLDDVAIARQIRQLERVGARGQRHARHLHRSAEGEKRFLVPLIRASGRRDEHCHGGRAARRFHQHTHEIASLVTAYNSTDRVLHALCLERAGILLTCSGKRPRERRRVAFLTVRG